jgi:hypothetical protein
MTAQALQKYTSRFSRGVIILELFITNKKTCRFMEIIIIIGFIGLILTGEIFKMGGK